MGHTAENKKKLLARVGRIQGQMKAIQKAVEEESACAELLQVVASCRGALNGLMSELIEGHLYGHVLAPRAKRTSDQLKAADELMAVVTAYLR